MAFITAQPGYYTTPLSVNVNGVLSANPPLSISGTTLSIPDADIASSGVVNTIAQSFGGAKNCHDGFTVGNTQVVTSISTDSTFVTATDSELSTKKAIKDYITTGPATFITSVTLPLYVVGQDLRIYNASLIDSGVVSTSSQTFAGQKRFNSQASFEANISMDNTFPAANAIWSTGIDSVLNVGAASLGSEVDMYSLNQGGALILMTGKGLSLGIPTKLKMVDGLTLTTFFEGSHTAITSNRATTIDTTSYGGTSLTLKNGATQTTFNQLGTGDLTIDSSGGDLILHTTDRLNVNNGTVSTSKTTGAIVVNGGIGSGDSIWCSNVVASSVTFDQYKMIATPGQEAILAVDTGGKVKLAATGTAPYFTIDLNTVNYYDLDATRASMPGVTNRGSQIFKSVSPTYSPTGAGPFDDYTIDDVATVYIFDLASMTSGADLTGIKSTAMPNSRSIEIIFKSTGGSKTIVIKHDTGSATANRFYCANSTDITLTVNVTATMRLFYSGDMSRWIVMSYTG